MMEENLRLVDALIYVVDSRAVRSCDNPLFDKLLRGKNVLYVFNKCDLVKPDDLNEWCDSFKQQNKTFVKAVGTSGDCSQIVEGLKRVSADKITKYAQKGANVRVRAMVIGVPNSGKSTIVNAMCKKAKAATGDRPGVTRGKQWLSIDGVDFLDTPGTLWGKFDSQTTAHHLAYIGSIRSEVLDLNELAYDFLEEAKGKFPEEIERRYGVKAADKTALELFEEIAAGRGYKSKGGEYDYDRTAKMIIDEFRKGLLGKIMLEKPSDF